MKVQDFNRQFSEQIIDLNRMNWYVDIFLETQRNQIQIGKIENGVLIQLLYKGYNLFFIQEYQENPYRNNVFWVNILRQGTIFDNHKNESILTYKFGEHNDGCHLHVNSKSYIGVHTGNLYERYRSVKGKDMTERNMWFDISNYLNGKEGSLEFVVSYFGEYLIAYGLRA